MKRKLKDIKKLGRDLIPLKEAMLYLPYKSFVPVRKMIRSGELKGVIYKGKTKDGDRFFVYPKSIRDFWK